MALQDSQPNAQWWSGNLCLDSPTLGLANHVLSTQNNYLCYALTESIQINFTPIWRNSYQLLRDTHPHKTKSQIVRLKLLIVRTIWDIGTRISNIVWTIPKQGAIIEVSQINCFCPFRAQNSTATTPRALLWTNGFIPLQGNHANCGGLHYSDNVQCRRLEVFAKQQFFSKMRVCQNSIKKIHFVISLNNKAVFKPIIMG